MRCVTSLLAICTLVAFAGPAPADPWSLAAEPVPFRDACFRPFPAEAPDLTPEEAARWLEPVEGFPLELTDSKDGNVGGVVLDGLARLRAPWPGDAVLRLLLDTRAELKLHFWSGDSGVSFRRYYQSGGNVRPWAAYRLGRRPAQPLVLDGHPHHVVDPQFCLIGTDSHRNRGAETGIYEVRYQDDSLVLSRGDVRLLTVPLAAPPAEVYFEADGALLSRIDLFRGGPIPERPEPARESVVRGRRPSELRWQAELPEGAHFAKSAGGPVRLHARGNEAPALAAVPLVRPDLYEIVLAVDSPRPGTGVYLADRSGTVLAAAGFVRDTRTGRAVLHPDLPDAQPPTLDADPDRQPVPYIAGRVWLRLVLAGGRLHCWLSGDGVHWGEVHPPHPAGGPVAQVGLYCKAGDGARSITLHKLFVRRLDGLDLAAPRALFENALALGLPPDVSPVAWEAWVWENQPAGADPLAWRRAAALALLVLSSDQPLIDSALDGLVREVLREPENCDAKLRMFEDLALVCNMHSSGDVARVGEWFVAFGRELLRTGDWDRLAALRGTALHWPRMSHQGALRALDETLLEETLLAKVAAGEWEAIADLAAQLRFWNETPTRQRQWSSNLRPLATHVDWARGLAASRAPGRALDQLGRDPRWRHPAEVEAHKDAHNTLLELQFALKDRAWRSAAQILRSSAVPQWGLVPDPADPQRFLTFAAVVAETMEGTPEFLDAMRQTVGTAERVRLRQAKAAGDAATVQDATVQYYGTPAAAEALMWLGDRRLAWGEFDLALRYYDRAMPRVDSQWQGQLAARRRLTFAMLGREYGPTVTEPVEFGEAELSPDAFESLVAEMLATHQVPDNGRAGASEAPARVPVPAALTEHSLGMLDGSAGENRSSVPGASQQVDWSARQHAMKVAGELLLVSNRFQLAAYRTDTGERAWSFDLGEQAGNAHAWPLTPMPPLVAGDRVYVRMIDAQQEPRLYCLDLHDGALAWAGLYPGAVAGDPMFARDRVLALCVPRSPDELASQVVLASFHPQTGAVLDEVPLLSVGGQWHTRRVCQAVLVDHRVVAVVEGTVLCCDTAGQLRWIRRQPWLPPVLDSDAGRRHAQPPLVAGSRVLVMQPGHPAVECLDLATGRLHWRLPLPRGRRLLGIAGGVLVVAAADGLRGLCVETGTSMWTHPEPDLLEAAVMGSDGRLLYVRHCPQRKVPFAALQWRDGPTGRLLGRRPLGDVVPNHVLVGPLTTDGRHIWYLRAAADEEGKLASHRALVEVTPGGPLLPPVGEPPASWNPNVASEVRLGAEIVLPGWTVFSAPEHSEAGLKAETAGRMHVLATHAAGQPVGFLRRVHVPEEGNPRLAIELAHDPAMQSRIEVRASGLPIWQSFLPAPADDPDRDEDEDEEDEQEDETNTPPEPVWAEYTIDLSPYRGKHLWLTVVQEAVGSQGATALWRRVELEADALAAGE